MSKELIAFEDTPDYSLPELSKDVLNLFDSLSKKRQAVTFDELTLEDQPSNIRPADASLNTFVTTKIQLKIPIISAAMDTVTERELALAMAKAGGLGVLHRNLSIEEQVDALKWVRRKIHSGGMIDRPICFSPTQRISDLQERVEREGFSFSSFPIVDDKGRFVGLITRDEVDFAEGKNVQLGSVMKKRSHVITTLEGTETMQAYDIMKREMVKKLPVVDKNDRLLGMYVWRDVSDDRQHTKTFILDDEGHFLVAAAVGCGSESELKRAEALIEAGARVLVIDSSHGACKDARDLLHLLKKEHGPKLQIIVGNIASYKSAKYLLEAPSVDLLPDGLKVGIGPGSICTTRRVSGHGVPQMTAIFEVAKAVREANVKPVPVIADGGIRCSGDVVKCFAVGASCVMLGSMLAGTQESAGRVVKRGTKLYKTYRGMGSAGAMAERSGSRMRYQADVSDAPTERLTLGEKAKVVPEGVAGLVELSGKVETVLNSMCGGIQGGLSHSGAVNISEFQNTASLWRQSNIGASEGRVHDVKEVVE